MIGPPDISWALVTIAAAAAISALTTGLYRSFALKRRILDHPVERSLHQIPTPRGGGVGVVTVMMATTCFLLHRVRPEMSKVLFADAVGAAGIAVISWIDDLGGLPASLRLAVQTGASLLLLAALWAAGFFASFSTLGAIAGIAAIWLWLTGWTNSFNFMDGIDGIAGLQAAVIGLAWLLLGEASEVRWLGAALSGASLGFLIFNWPPAKIFMGDVGSAFSGFAIASLPLLNLVEHRPDGRSLIHELAWSTTLAWPFFFDTTFTLARRWRRRENLAKAHRSHLYQRLVQTGMSHMAVTLLYGTLAILGCGLGALWCHEVLSSVVVAAILATSALGLLQLTYCREQALKLPSRA